MRQLGAVGGRRAGELRRERNKSLAQLVRERYLLEVDPVLQELTEAFRRGDFDAVLAIVHRARGPQEYAEWLRWREAEEYRLRRREQIDRAQRLASLRGLNEDDDDYEESESSWIQPI